MRRTVPLKICLIGGIVFIIQFFIPHKYSKTFFDNTLDWLIVCGVFALVIGLQNAFQVHFGKLRRRKAGWGYSVITMISIVTVALIGIIDGVGAESLFMSIYRHLNVPMQSTMFSLLGFYMASAAFRAFKAKTKESTVLLLVAVFMMLGRVPLGYFLWHGWPDAVEWFLMYPNTAAQRGILLGIGLGAVATQLKIILGIERGWLGGVGK